MMNDFSNITYGMFGMYVKFINEGYDVCILDYDGSIGSSLNQIRTQLKQIYDECEYSEIKMISVDRELLSKLCAYYAYNFPFSLHSHSPFFEKSMCDDVRNIVERNVNNYTSKLFILCGNNDDNTKYNVEFYNLYNSLKQIRK